MLRCGGSVRFKNWQSLTTDYNAIPSSTSGQNKIEEIRAVKACITFDGFAYLGCEEHKCFVYGKYDSSHLNLDGLTDLKKIHLEKCDQLGDGKRLIEFYCDE